MLLGYECTTLEKMKYKIQIEIQIKFLIYQGSFIIFFSTCTMMQGHPTAFFWKVRVHNYFTIWLDYGPASSYKIPGRGDLRVHLTRVRRDKCKLNKRANLLWKMFVPHNSCSHCMRSKPKCKHNNDVHTTKAFVSLSEISMHFLASSIQIWRIVNFCYCTYNRGVVLVLTMNAQGVYLIFGVQ